MATKKVKKVVKTESSSAVKTVAKKKVSTKKKVTATKL